MNLIIAGMDIRRYARSISRHEFFSILGRIVLSKRGFIPHSERREIEDNHHQPDREDTEKEKEQNLHNGVGDSH